MPIPYTRAAKQNRGAGTRDLAESCRRPRTKLEDSPDETWWTARGRISTLLIALLAGCGAGASSDRPRRSVSSTKSPEPGQVLSLRAPDPGGGLPWGLRLVRTQDGLLCAQVGRVSDGVLGQVGVDGAFEDDRTFHALEASELAGV